MNEPQRDNSAPAPASVSIERLVATQGSEQLHARILATLEDLAKRERITLKQACILAHHGRAGLAAWKALGQAG